MAIRERETVDPKTGKKQKHFLVVVFRGYEAGPDGKPRRTEVRQAAKNKKDAQALEADIKRQLAQGTWIEPNRLTVQDYLAEWLEKSVKVTRAPQTAELYSNIVRIYVNPALGAQRLTNAHPLALQGLLNDLAGRGFARSTVKNVQTVLRAAFTQAVRWRYIHHSPAEHLDLPRDEEVGDEELMQAMDSDQAKAFMAAAKAERFGMVLVFALVTGCRPGEYLGLFWSDINWKAQTVRIERTLFRPKGGGWKLGKPKTKTSYRTIPLPPELVDMLRQHRTAQLEQRLAIGQAWQDEGDFVFRNENGGPMDSKRLARRYFKRVLKAAGLPEHFVLYNLRHTCATLLLLAGEQPKVVSERLGHSSISVTMDIYSKVLPSMQNSATEKLRAMLF